MADVVQGRELCARRGLPSRPALACDKPRDSWALPRDVRGGSLGCGFHVVAPPPTPHCNESP